MREPFDERLIKSICKVLKLMIDGKVPSKSTPVLYGAVLAPLRKKDGGLRPTAIGTTLRRLAAKLVSKRSLLLNNILMPSQVGFATRSGCEVTVHAARSYNEGRLESDVTHGRQGGHQKRIQLR